MKKEEPKQETTLEEVAEKLKSKELFKESNDRARKILSEIKSLPIQEQMYSEEEVLEMLEDYDREFKLDTFAYTNPCSFTVKEWFETVKKK